MKTIKLILLIATVLSFSQVNALNTWWWRKKQEVKVDTIYTNIDGSGFSLTFEVKTGKGHNNPTFAIWIEDMNGNFLHELYVTKSVATGIFRFGDTSSGKWEAGERRYRAALPYFFHKRSKDRSNPDIPSVESPLIDAFTGATPKNNFDLFTKTDSKDFSQFRIIMEVNQTWDFNNYWHNAKFPDDADYRTSAQPSLVYAVTIDTKNLMDEYYMNPIGHGHYSGKTGNLYTNLSTFTTALEIFSEIKVMIQP